MLWEKKSFCGKLSYIGKNWRVLWFYLWKNLLNVHCSELDLLHNNESHTQGCSGIWVSPQNLLKKALLLRTQKIFLTNFRHKLENSVLRTVSNESSCLPSKSTISQQSTFSMFLGSNYKKLLCIRNNSLVSLLSK